MELSNPKHPAWPCIRLAIIMGGMTVMLWVTASSFDATELQAIGGTGLIALIANFIRPSGGTNADS